MNENYLKNHIINGLQLSRVIQNSLKERLLHLLSVKSQVNSNKLRENNQKNLDNYTNHDISNKISFPEKQNSIFHAPKLKVILVEERYDSKLYIRNKLKYSKSIGIETEVSYFISDVSKTEIISEIEKSNQDHSIHGIIIQLPLPKNLNSERKEIFSKIDIKKDVEGLNLYNLSDLENNPFSNYYLPPTASGVLEMIRLVTNFSNNLEAYKQNYLKYYLFDDQPLNLKGKTVTILGQGLSAGLPISKLLEKCNCIVNRCDIMTSSHLTKKKCLEADILISAVGKSNLINREYIKDDAIVIDVGINYIFDKQGNKFLTGDVDFYDVIDKVKFISPVPGGVGRMTVMMLFKNVIKAWANINKIDLKKM
jgi:5,10-methylene-tetrahydrofolate dehydrogenase/methenyl tetrahydrofolate cyclohydrolase